MTNAKMPANADSVNSTENERIPVISHRDGRLITDSRDMADYFGKRHTNVLAAIDKHLGEVSPEFGRLNFKPISYIDGHGRRQRCFELTQAGFAYVASAFTGSEVAPFKEAYINQFEAMRNELMRLHNLDREEVIKQGTEDRNFTTKVYQDHGATKPYHYKNLTNANYKITIGCTAQTYRKEHGLSKKSNIRPHLPTSTLRRVCESERLSAERVVVEGRKGYYEIKEAVEETAEQYMEAVAAIRASWKPKEISA